MDEKVTMIELANPEGAKSNRSGIESIPQKIENSPFTVVRRETFDNMENRNAFFGKI